MERFLCEIGIHVLYMYSIEEGKGKTFKRYQQCNCGKKKEYIDAEFINDNDLINNF